MDLPTDELDEAAFCAEFQQLGQIVEELHGFSFTNTTVPLFGEQPYTCITYVEFDQKENLIWITNDQGHATSFYRASLNVYSKFWWSLDKTDLIPNEIVTTDAYVIFIGKTQLAIFTRGGAPVMRYRPETIKTINCAHWSPTAPCFLYFGGEQHSIGIFNLETCKEIKGIETEDDCCLIRSTDRFLVSASKKGQISVRHKDFSLYKLTAKTIAHNAGIEDFDVFGNYLVCCGKSTRQHGVAQGDVFMKVYDIRNLGAQSPIGFNRPPIQVKFVPGLDGCICVSTGLCLFMVDILNNKTSMFVSFTLPSDGISISNSGQAIAAFINNYTPYLQIFCTSMDPPFSIFNIDSIFPIQNEELFVQFDDKTSLAVFPVAYMPRDYCSDKWSGSISQPRYL
ncbi:PAB-dependent poly(A)-specific ribonuclease subunit PAN2 [Aphelenchoides bicaudatus]|nr:PAB-dependent poly(A)-specific ribonuclease subunit PAN2 [Aphelenchoides bicaudatus]